jgi:sulfhydrogenase subunit gamma (sulfur reductase)
MDSLLQPQKLKITKIEQHSPTVKLFRLEPKGFLNLAKDENGMVFAPGQFVLVGAIGYGESAFGPLSSPYEDRYIEILVRNVGLVTNFLHSLKEGDEVTLRGPFGNGFPLEYSMGKSIVLATGGCGIPPIGAFIEFIIKNKENYGDIYLLYGAKSPEEILIKDRMEEWKKGGINVLVTIDKPAQGWKGPVGFLPALLGEVIINPKNTIVAMCGPWPMVTSLEKPLREMGLSDRNIFVNMERNMQCGIGKCQHCTCGKKYVCTDGPVFNLDEVDKNWD